RLAQQRKLLKATPLRPWLPKRLDSQPDVECGGWASLPCFRVRTPSQVCQLLCPPYRQMGTVAHSQPHAPASTKLFFFSSNAENRRVVFSSPPALGAGGLEFESPRPDQFYE